MWVVLKILHVEFQLCMENVGKDSIRVGKSKKLLFLKISLAILGILIIILIIKYFPVIVALTLSVEKFRDYILSVGKLGPAVFILFQILQTVIAPIPGEAIQIAGGYIYGVLLGTGYTVAGMLIGAVMAFYFTRILGGSYIEKILEKKKFQWMADIMNGNKFAVFLFVFFFIPGLPKDILIYLAGLTKIKPYKFFLVLLAGRLPWLLASVSVGANLYQKNYTLTIIISVIALLGALLGLLFKDKVIYKFSSKDKRAD